MPNSFSRKQITAISAGILIIAVAALLISRNLSKHPAYNFTEVKNADLTQGVTETGTVTSAQDLSLSFQRSGSIAEADVNAGDRVSKGQALLKLDLKDAAASVSQAAAALQVAQANYDKVISGATAADVQVAQTALDNAQKTLDATAKQQSLLVSNAQSAYLNTVSLSGLSNGLTAVPAAGNLSSAAITITGTYNDTTQGQYALTAYSTGSGMKFNVSGLETATMDVKSAPLPLGTKGLYISVNGTPSPGDTWTISIPNTQSPSYLPDYNAYLAAQQTRDQAVLNAQNAVTAAQAALNLKTTPARPEDVAAAKAQVATAQAALQAAQNAYSEGILTSPIDGLVTSVDGKVGELAVPGKEVVALISSQKFQINTYVSDADLSKIKTGDAADITLDAYGSNTVFPATVIAIDPAATVINGVSSYKTTLQFNNDDSRIKEGLSANITVKDATRENVLAVPTGDIITKNARQFVIKQTGPGQTEETAITTGIAALNGLTEITSGLNAGDQVVNLGN